jgi:tyrosine decarboxylase/aspartate 1-decarboxylase
VSDAGGPGRDAANDGPGSVTHSAAESSGPPQSFERVLSSMCTEPHPDARAAAERFLATNPGDPATYEAVATLEERAVGILGEMAGAPDAVGSITSGGTESNLQALRAARNRATVGAPTVVAPDHVHFSVRKAAAVLDVELRTTATVDGVADPAAIAEAVGPDTCCVVCVAGTTEYGLVDPVPEIAEIAAEAGAHCHVDAAWGGFYLPFTDHAWDFADAPINTLTLDPHKVGRAVIPAGGFLARDASTMEALAVDTPYLESADQVSVTGTRSGAGVASAAAALEALWPDGYRAEYERAMACTEWLAGALRDRDLSVVDPELPLVAVDIADDTFAALRDDGWRIARTRAGETRIVVMPHVTRERLEAFLAALDRVQADD